MLLQYIDNRSHMRYNVKQSWRLCEKVRLRLTRKHCDAVRGSRAAPAGHKGGRKVLGVRESHEIISYIVRLESCHIWLCKHF